jgi:hypothetical protein
MRAKTIHDDVTSRKSGQAGHEARGGNAPRLGVSGYEAPRARASAPRRGCRGGAPRLGVSGHKEADVINRTDAGVLAGLA